MAEVRSLCVFCGSRFGDSPTFREAGARLGAEMAREGVDLVYGGGRVGIMGTVADAVLAGGGRVVGVIPEFLKRREVGHSGIQELVETTSMHERKQRMFDLSDGFVVLPGGIGTLDEMVEILSWRQLGLHDKPLVIVDVDGYWSRLQALFDAVVERGFADRSVLGLYTIVPRVEDVLPAVRGLPAETSAVPSERL